MNAIYAEMPKPIQADRWRGWARMGAWLRGVLVWILAILLLIPPLLLFANTAVPLYLTVALLLGDAVLIVLFARRRVPAIALLAGLLAAAELAVGASQYCAATPPIQAAAGSQAAQSIAVMEKVTLGGSEEWITIRGKDSRNPILLYLGIGGPGAGGFPANALTLAPLEDDFVVVNWDQPGTGKSYDAVEISTLTVDRFVADAHDLTEMLRARFHQDKIYVFGLSWGTIVGIRLVQQYPDLFYAYVGSGQMVNTTENDRLGYKLALQVAADRKDEALVRRLTANGPPPYTGMGMALKYAAYNNVLFQYMDSATLDMVLLVVPHMAREYGLIDRVNFARGLLDSFPVVYPQLRDLDFTTQAARLQVPVYFLVGRNDVNAMASLVERYYQVLEAPHKQLIWLEGGHGATPEQIREVMVNQVLPQSDLGD
jgi:pimeloyl-ACP methyl ester carboxylesterase